MDTSEPLGRFTSIKVKLGALVALSVVIALVLYAGGDAAGVPWWLTVPTTVAAALGVSAWMARGMTAPLRRMTVAAHAMARGDYRARVVTDAGDEVGVLAGAFNQMSADLATADEQRRHLIATVSHELRTPLAAQRALLENLADGVIAADPARLNDALRQAERLSRLVEDLLDLSRLESGSIRLHLADVSVSDLLSEAVTEASLTPRNVTYAVSVTPPELSVLADEQRVTQILANLLDNAARHSPPGGHVTVAATAASDDAWTLEVTDDGEGIPAEDREAVFARFGASASGGPGASTARTGGTGLGLAIARWVSELHGGRIVVLDRPDGRSGACLRLTLPTAPAQPPEGRNPMRSDDSAQDAPSVTALEQPVRQPAMVATAPSAPAAPSPSATPGNGGVLDALFGRLWPEGDLSPQPRLVLGAVGVGLLAAIILPTNDIGLGTFVVLVAAGCLLYAAAAHRHTAFTRISVVLCLGLAALSVVRADPAWAVLGMLLGGVVIASALIDARTLVEMIVGPVAWVTAGVRGLPLLGRTLGVMSRRRLLWPILRTGAITAVILVLFGTLFSAADAVFGHYMAELVPQADWATIVAQGFTWFVVAGVTLAGSYLALNPPQVLEFALPARRSVRHRWEWFVPVGALLAIYLAFLVALASAMWGGDDYVRRTTGLTYASYVHQGFGQLVAATFFTVLIVGFAAPLAPRTRALDRRLAAVILLMLGAASLTVVVSALRRMAIYQEAYGFTVMRLSVDVLEVWLGLIIVVVVLGGVLGRRGWVPRTVLVTGVAAFLGLSLMNPEAWAARHNIDRYAATGSLDGWYLASLGEDAAPTVAASALSPDLKRCVLGNMNAAYDNTTVWSWNRARSAGRPFLVPMAPRSDDCADLLEDQGVHEDDSIS